MAPIPLSRLRQSSRPTTRATSPTSANQLLSAGSGPRRSGPRQRGLTMTAPAPTKRRHPADAPRFPERGRSSLGYWLYFIPGALLVSVVIFYPIIRNFRLSFFHWRGGRAEEQFAGLDNWIKLFGDTEFLQSFKNIVLVILAMVVIPTLLGLVIAALLFDVVGRRFGAKVSSFLRATYYLPQILPIAVAGVLFGWLLKPDGAGVFNQFLSTITGSEVEINWLGGSYSTAMLSVMILMI